MPEIKRCEIGLCGTQTSSPAEAQANIRHQWENACNTQKEHLPQSEGTIAPVHQKRATHRPPVAMSKMAGAQTRGQKRWPAPTPWPANNNNRAHKSTMPLRDELNAHCTTIATRATDASTPRYPCNISRKARQAKQPAQRQV